MKIEIGTKFTPVGRKHAKEETVVDIHTTTNLKGEVVKVRYVTEHEFMGQIVRNSDVVATTILRALDKQKEERQKEQETPTRSLKQVNKAIQELYPTLELVKGEGYFYIFGSDDPTGLELAMLEQTSIYVDKISHLTVERWISNVTDLVKHLHIPRTAKAPERVPMKGEDEGQ